MLKGKPIKGQIVQMSNLCELLKDIILNSNNYKPATNQKVMQLISYAYGNNAYAYIKQNLKEVWFEVQQDESDIVVLFSLETPKNTFYMSFPDFITDVLGFYSYSLDFEELSSADPAVVLFNIDKR